MIISSLENNTLIEARSYQHGYGIVQEIELGKVFKDMPTYGHLIKAFHARKGLVRLDRSGNEVENIKKFKLLKMSSVWKHVPVEKNI